MNKANLINSPSFCVYPWIHFYAIPNGKIYPCCSHDSADSISTITGKDINAILNEEAFKQLRLKMLRGETSPNFCRKCINEEKINVESSARYSANNYYLDFEDIIQEINNTSEDGTVSGKIRYFDMRTSNLCNVMCQTCDGTFSSSLNSKIIFHNDKKKIKGLTQLSQSNETIFSQLKNLDFLKNLKKIYFAGGEPLISVEHYEILENLIFVNRNLHIAYNTNFLKLNYRKFDILQMWSNFDNIDVSISIDDIGNRYEYTRYPSNFEKLIENCKRFHNTIENSYSNFSVTVTVSFLNIFYLDELIHFLITEKIIGHPSKIHLYPLINPDLFSISVLPTNVKKIIQCKLYSVSRTYNDDTLTNKINFVIETMNTIDNSHKLEKTYKKIEYNQEVRGQQEKFCKIFEEYCLLLPGYRV